MAIFAAIFWLLRFVIFFVCTRGEPLQVERGIRTRGWDMVSTSFVCRSRIKMLQRAMLFASDLGNQICSGLSRATYITMIDEIQTWIPVP